MGTTNSSATTVIFLLYQYDIHLSAYLQFRGLIPELKKEGTRVVFGFPNTLETQRLIEEYHNNPTVKLVDYISHLRRLRAQMLAMRDQTPFVKREG